MRKTILTLTLSALALVTMAGGIVHNTNQSASFIRMPARDASLGLDATYFNPAGMSYLKDGFHLGLSNQFITQSRNIKTTYPGLNRSEFEGKVVAPLFPSAYAIFKKGNFAASFAFNPIGGGGGALSKMVFHHLKCRLPEFRVFSTQVVFQQHNTATKQSLKENLYIMVCNLLQATKSTI